MVSSFGIILVASRVHFSLPLIRIFCYPLWGVHPWCISQTLTSSPHFPTHFLMRRVSKPIAETFPEFWCILRIPNPLLGIRAATARKFDSCNPENRSHICLKSDESNLGDLVHDSLLLSFPSEVCYEYPGDLYNHLWEMHRGHLWNSSRGPPKKMLRRPQKRVAGTSEKLASTNGLRGNSLRPCKETHCGKCNTPLGFP